MRLGLAWWMDIPATCRAAVDRLEWGLFWDLCRPPFRHLLEMSFGCLPQSLGPATCRMFRSYGEALTVVVRSLLGVDKEQFPEPIGSSHHQSVDLMQANGEQLALYGRYDLGNRTRLGLPFTCVCAHTENRSEHLDTFLIRYRSGGTPGESRSSIVG
jgi:hypothetical protein